MKFDVVKVCAGLIVILALLMCSSVATETTWRRSGFELWGYDINFTNMNASNVWVLDLEDNGIPGISASNSGKIYYNDINASILVSVNGSAYSEMQTADMKDIADGIAGLNSMLMLMGGYPYPIYEEYNNRLGVLDNYLQKTEVGTGTVTTDTTNHEFDISCPNFNDVAYLETKDTFTLSTKPIVINFISHNGVSGTAGFSYTGLHDGVDINTPANGVYLRYNNNMIDGGLVWKPFCSNGGVDTEGVPFAYVSGRLITIIATSSKVMFYEDGVLKDTITTNIPAGALHFRSQFKNDGDAISMSLDNIGIIRYR